MTMLSIFSKTASYVWEQLPYFTHSPAVVDSPDISDSSSETDDDQRRENICQEIHGTVTNIDPSERFGLVNGDIYFSYDVVTDVEHPNVGDRVVATVHKFRENDPWKATRITIADEYWDDDEKNSLKPPNEKNTKASIGLIDSVECETIELADGTRICMKDVKCDGFKPLKGDIVQYSLEEKELSPARTREIKGEVTRINADGTGNINHEVWFNPSSCLNCFRPRKGQNVSVIAIESHQMSFMWRALKVVPGELPRVYEKNVHFLQKKSPVQKHFLQDLLSDKNGISITTPLDFGIMSQDKKGYITTYISNSGKEVHLLKTVRFQRKEIQMSLGSLEHCDNLTTELASKEFKILPQCSAYLNIYCEASQLGNHRELLLFEFEGFQIGRYVLVHVKHPLEDTLPKSTTNDRFTRNRYQSGKDVNKDEYILPGEKPFRSQHYLPVNMQMFNVPEKLKSVVLERGDILSIAPSLIKDLSLQNYYDRFSALLHLEEIQMQQEMREFDMEDVCLGHMGYDFLSLSVPGLAEGRPSLLIGDKVYLRSPDGTEPVYQGFIHEVLKDCVLIKFHSSFHNSYSGASYNVSFEFGRTGMRRCHQAAKQAASLVPPQVLFPVEIKIEPPVYQGKMQWFNQWLNCRQRSAVIRILGHQCRPLPYVIFGPPGTGKTVTVVEAILQVFKAIKSSRIIVCTPTNSAADLIAVLLLKYRTLGKNDLARLNAFQRNRDSIPECIQDYCYFGDEKMVKIAYHRILVSTCSNIGILYGQKLLTGHYTHLFLDEAGQATEPESLVAMELVTAMGTGGQVILAGDQKQLGPCLRSNYAKFYGLQLSFLERLMSRQIYCSDSSKFADHGNYDPLIVTKLVQNYRSHAAILKLYSDLFYQSELKPSAHDLTKVEWDRLPNQEFPLLFHGVSGEEIRESDSPSWFNPAEVVQIVTYLKELYDLQFMPDDIGIITPYRKQVQKIYLLCETLCLDMCKVGSVEEFQGQERKIIILSTVRCASTNTDDVNQKYDLGFVNEEKRFNVAISRAQSLLIVIGDPNLLGTSEHWKALLKYALDNRSYVGCKVPAI